MPISQAYLGSAEPPSGIKSFYFIRHGTTDLNEKEMVVNGEKHWGVQGSGTNIGLNEKGVRQALLAGNVLRTLPISKVVCSPLLRALQTAFIANPGCPTFQIEDDLQERDFGEHEGGFGPLQMFEDDYPDCEPTEIFSIHVAKALKHARKENVLLVAHGGVLRVVAALLGVAITDEHTDNGRVLHFSLDAGNWSVRVIQSRVVMVSGATRGIGKAIAQELIRHGYRVSLGARNVQDLEAVFGDQNEALHYACFDALDHSSMKDWVSTTVAKFNKIDGLVNNAGCVDHVDLEKEINVEMLQKQWDINCVAPLIMTKLCMPYLIESGSGRIVNLNSMSRQRGFNSFVGYNVTNHACGSLTQIINHIGLDHRVGAIDICLAVSATNMSSLTDTVGPEHIAKLIREEIERPNIAFN
ncbi:MULTISPECIES: SDR family NAD(P)-dependent oxidoreductase [Agrobacterium tumefaciens complex]|uniref:Agropine synthesis reductase n=1 Tax=Agrobacterium fabrum TaxID=1176649 RepID=A0A2Z2PG20_9HYPH|nr:MULTISPECIES: SDR family NAD(P)-dependent oxidoreductase [Agrobacterium tumefaciens complex]ASK41887.1 agropine synthesis reductase [Agrobacterium fabrum]NSL21076.1 SDR family NAD(P)-dependent oxidoreductase [Agrobacterium tumefaciens]NTC57399.1 SDR family NAD(P)-dependent oxidoreductase [Agrobacterium tumefaciens]NTC59483.1 SDR family NAD(P)-dependent oxidoreductase [Agrobacterium tumefaciens]NTC66569.1 SDR family NAD(P)-dependent oxidoreductase [Agrobacterium tumefaciens]